MTVSGRVPAPWTYRLFAPGVFVVEDAEGVRLAWVHYGVREVVGTNQDSLSEEQARRIAANIARLPGLLSKG
jgi:hypothetical protein